MKRIDELSVKKYSCKRDCTLLLMHSSIQFYFEIIKSNLTARFNYLI